jgi:hypothetical protein
MIFLDFIYDTVVGNKGKIETHYSCYNPITFNAITTKDTLQNNQAPV